MKFRKRAPASHPDKDPFSGQLRAARDAIQRRDIPGGLGQLNALLSDHTDDRSKGRILSLAADSQFKQAKYADALASYRQAGLLLANQPRDWLRPVIGEIRALLKSGQVADAVTCAQLAFDKAAALEAQFAQAVRNASAQNQVYVAPRPWRTSVISTRLAKLFFAEGEVAAAQDLLNRALAANPQGATVARLVLADIALRSGDAAAAAAQAKQAMLLGNCRAKTLAGWTLFMTAARRAGQEPYDAQLLAALAQAPRRIRARASVLIVRTLRDQGDARWRGIADNWLGGNGTANAAAAAELRKMIAASVQQSNGGAVQQQQAAQAILNTANLGPGEWLSATKASLRAGLLTNQVPDFEALLQQGGALFGAALRRRLAHALARVCLRSGRADLARPLLARNLKKAAGRGSQWGRSSWALARLEEAQGNFAPAAQLYWTYSQELAMPVRLRLYAQVNWAHNLIKAGQPEAILDAQDAFLATVLAVQDYELVLDVARQLTLAPRDLNALAEQVRARGEALARQALADAQDPALTLSILYKLARRQSDFGRHEAITQIWEQFSPENKNWLWSPKGDFWEYLALVFRAYQAGGRVAEAEALANQYLNDAATPPEGVAVLGVTYGLLRISRRQFAQGMALFERALTLAPTHPMSAHAHYWKALAAWKQGDSAGAAQWAARMQLALGVNPGMIWQKRLDAKAVLLAAGLDPARVNSSRTAYNQADYAAALAGIQADLGFVA